jgi:hypothetical protein
MHQITTTTGITIAIVKRPQDWQRILHSKQYHLPVRHVTGVMQSPWVAFYFPRWHTMQAHSICHIGSITAMTITPRRTYLPDEHANPRADQLYAVLTFEAIYQLRVPIRSAHWRRVSIHHTTWGAFTRTYDLGALYRVTQQMHDYRHIDDFDLFDMCEPDDIKLPISPMNDDMGNPKEAQAFSHGVRINSHAPTQSHLR